MDSIDKQLIQNIEGDTDIDNTSAIHSSNASENSPTDPALRTMPPTANAIAPQSSSMYERYKQFINHQDLLIENDAPNDDDMDEQPENNLNKQGSVEMLPIDPLRLMRDDNEMLQQLLKAQGNSIPEVSDKATSDRHTHQTEKQRQHMGNDELQLLVKTAECDSPFAPSGGSTSRTATARPSSVSGPDNAYRSSDHQGITSTPPASSSVDAIAAALKTREGEITARLMQAYQHPQHQLYYPSSWSQNDYMYGSAHTYSNHGYSYNPCTVSENYVPSYMEHHHHPASSPAATALYSQQHHPAISAMHLTQHLTLTAQDSDTKGNNTEMAADDRNDAALLEEPHDATPEAQMTDPAAEVHQQEELDNNKEQKGGKESDVTASGIKTSTSGESWSIDDLVKQVQQIYQKVKMTDTTSSPSAASTSTSAAYSVSEEKGINHENGYDNSPVQLSASRAYKTTSKGYNSTGKQHGKAPLVGLVGQQPKPSNHEENTTVADSAEGSNNEVATDTPMPTKYTFLRSHSRCGVGYNPSLTGSTSCSRVASRASTANNSPPSTSHSGARSRIAFGSSSSRSSSSVSKTHQQQEQQQKTKARVSNKFKNAYDVETPTMDTSFNKSSSNSSAIEISARSKTGLKAATPSASCGFVNTSVSRQRSSSARRGQEASKQGGGRSPLSARGTAITPKARDDKLSRKTLAAKPSLSALSASVPHTHKHNSGTPTPVVDESASVDVKSEAETVTSRNRSPARTATTVGRSVVPLSSYPVTPNKKNSLDIYEACDEQNETHSPPPPYDSHEIQSFPTAHFNGDDEEKVPFLNKEAGNTNSSYSSSPSVPVFTEGHHVGQNPNVKSPFKISDVESKFKSPIEATRRSASVMSNRSSSSGGTASRKPPLPNLFRGSQKIHQQLNYHEDGRSTCESTVTCLQRTASLPATETPARANEASKERKAHQSETANLSASAVNSRERINSGAAQAVRGKRTQRANSSAPKKKEETAMLEAVQLLQLRQESMEVTVKDLTGQLAAALETIEAQQLEIEQLRTNTTTAEAAMAETMARMSSMTDNTQHNDLMTKRWMEHMNDQFRQLSMSTNYCLQWIQAVNRAQDVQAMRAGGLMGMPQQSHPYSMNHHHHHHHHFQPHNAANKYEHGHNLAAQESTAPKSNLSRAAEHHLDHDHEIQSSGSDSGTGSVHDPTKHQSQQRVAPISKQLHRIDDKRRVSRLPPSLPLNLQFK